MIASTHLSSSLHGALSPVLARLGLTLIHTIWEGALAAALLWISLAILRGRSPQVRYLAGCAAALAMVVGMALTFLLVPASGTFPLPPSPEQGKNAVAAAAPGVPSSAGSFAESGLSVPSASSPQPGAVGRPFPTQGWRWLVTWCHRGATLLPSLALAWAVGVLALAGRLIVGYIGVRQLRSHGTSPAEPCWQQRLLALARRMCIKQPVSLRQSTGVTTPAVVGWLRPVILLPVGMCAGLSTAQVEMILAHELAHIGRQDYLVNLLLNVVETILFYHPAIWWIAARVREERENACDDLALAAGHDDRLGYARALASLEEMRLPGAQLALAARGGSGTLLARVRRLLGVPAARGYAFPLRNTACGLAATLVLSGAAAAVFLAAGLTPARSQESVNAAGKPSESAPSQAGQSTDDPEPAREHRITHVKVTDGTGRPVAGAKVSILGIRRTHSPNEYFDFDETLEDSWQTDGQGDAAVFYPRYTDDKHPIGTLHLLVKHPNFYDQQADWSVDGEQPPSKPVTLALGAKIRVRGHWPDSESGASRPAIHPELVADKFDDQTTLPETTLPDLPTADWHSLGDNEWESSTIPPGDYHLRVDHANADGTVLFSEVRQIIAVEGKTYAFDLEPQRGGRIEGRLDDTVPRPVVRGRVVAHVYATGPGKGAEYMHWDTWRTIAPDGTFVFESLPPGTAEITASCAGFTSANPPGVKRDGGSFTVPQSFAVSRDAKTTALVRMEPTASVEVEVCNEAGQPVSGVNVLLMSSTAFTPDGLAGFYGNLGRAEDAVAASPNVNLPRDQANADAPSLKGRTDGAGRVTIHDVPEGNHMMIVVSENYEWLPTLWHSHSQSLKNVELAPGETKYMAVQVRKKGTDPLKDNLPASTPASSPEASQMATPAPSPAASAVATPPTALERAWEEYTKVDAEVTRFDRVQQQMKPAEDEQEKQKSMAEFLALLNRYHDACAQFARLAPKEDSRRPLVLLLSTGSDKNATPAEHTAVIDEILATPTAPEEVQAHALALRENTAATAAKISEFLASYPQVPRRRELESKAARIRATDPSSLPASPEFPSLSPAPAANSSPGIKGSGAENPPPSQSAVSSGPAEEQPVPAPIKVSTDDKSRRDEVSRLGVAAMRGEYEAIEQLAKIAATANGMNADEKVALYADFRRTFAVFGAEAGRGNATALQTIQRASHLDELEGFAVEALGKVAGMGSAEALKPLLDPENHGILRSSAVAALKPAADAGNAQAIAALAATAADQKQHALWFLAADGLASAAGAGNTTAIDSLAALATDKNPGIHRAAILALEVSADKGHPSAQQALHKLGGG